MGDYSNREESNAKHKEIDNRKSNKWKKNTKDMVFTILGIILIAVDLVSDITLAMDYCLLDTEWCFLTWMFVAGPYFTAFIIILSFRYGSALKGEHGWAYWKATEVCFEAGPQLVLQLYIISLTDQDPTDESESSIFGMVVRFIAIVTSLLSLSFGFTTWRQFIEDNTFSFSSWKHIGVDIMWNIISISPRVIALALFASYEPYWFWGLVGSQILTVTATAFIAARKEDRKKSDAKKNPTNNGNEEQREGKKNTESSGGREKKKGRLFNFFMSSFTGIGMVFNMFIAGNFDNIPFKVYLLYWLFIFIENTVLVSLWYVWSSDLGLWYHDWAIAFVMIGYVLLLVIKVAHCYSYNNEMGFSEWNYFIKHESEEDKKGLGREGTYTTRRQESVTRIII